MAEQGIANAAAMQLSNLDINGADPDRVRVEILVQLIAHYTRRSENEETSLDVLANTASVLRSLEHFLGIPRGPFVKVSAIWGVHASHFQEVYIKADGTISSRNFINARDGHGPIFLIKAVKMKNIDAQLLINGEPGPEFLNHRRRIINGLLGIGVIDNMLISCDIAFPLFYPMQSTEEHLFFSHIHNYRPAEGGWRVHRYKTQGNEPDFIHLRN